jgi:hypothetical protein
MLVTGPIRQQDAVTRSGRLDHLKGKRGYCQDGKRVYAYLGLLRGNNLDWDGGQTWRTQ